MIREHSKVNPLRRPVLVLNASYEPIHVCAVRRALILLVKGMAATEESGEGRVHSPSQSLAVPSVIRLLEYRRIPRQMRAISRKNILIRDQHTCQYCNRQFGTGEFTGGFLQLALLVSQLKVHGRLDTASGFGVTYPIEEIKGSRTKGKAHRTA